MKKQYVWMIIGVIVVMILSRQPIKKESTPATGHLDHMNGRYDSNVPGDDQRMTWGSVFSGTATIGEYYITTGKNSRMDYFTYGCAVLPPGADNVVSLGMQMDTCGDGSQIECEHWDFDVLVGTCTWYRARGVCIYPGENPSTSCEEQCGGDYHFEYCSGQNAICVHRDTYQDFGGCIVTSTEDYIGCSMTAEVYKNGVLQESFDYFKVASQGPKLWADEGIVLNFGNDHVYLGSQFYCVRVYTDIFYRIPDTQFDVSFEPEEVIIDNNWKTVNGEIRINYDGTEDIIDVTIPTGQTTFDYDVPDGVTVTPSILIHEPVTNFQDVNAACNGYPVTDIQSCSRVELDTYTGDSYQTVDLNPIKDDFVNNDIIFTNFVTYANEWVNT